MPFAELDALYMHIFSSVVDPDPVMQILAHRLLSRHIFTDFLLDQSRSKQFWINAPLRCAEFAVIYLKDLPMTDTAVGNLVGYIEDAVPTLELRECISKLSFAPYLAEKRSYYNIPYFCATICHWKIDGSSIYDDQLRFFDHFAREILENMYSNSGLTALVAVAKLDIDVHRHYDALKNLFSLRRSLDSLDMLSFSWAAHFPSGYRPFILRFLEDPNRVGEYMLTGERYATAAAYFLKYVCNNPEQIIPSFFTVQRKYKKQINSPWHWRNTVAKNTFIRSRTDCPMADAYEA
ncbi:hypothetical protein GALMADRAFT_560727 [Galerina marginata CBS 339.88]|uniref:Uncharacterized protein n=1 Tax=Galerina marginata (strain CBS 339.88) TaxID=685588 RepID=A0A067SUY2_GALM3|nr:hypothetical protein GALMADRAFT_560727 [Galerina marginata CBS 339.88]